MNEDRLLAMSAFEAAYVIRTFRGKNRDLSTNEIIDTARAVRADFYAHDYEAGAAIESQISPYVASPLEDFFLAAIDMIVAEKSPIWARVAPAGRNHVLQAIGLNGIQCLRSAGLLSSDMRATSWWDALASASRGKRDARLLAQGREGERLSLAYERERMQAEGITRPPVWVAIEDNTVGYDILSYALHNGREVNRLIEVKTTSSTPPRMILSRNEWDTAKQYGATFEFHLWNINDVTLAIYSTLEIKPHIPIDNGSGRWESVEIYPA